MSSSRSRIALTLAVLLALAFPAHAAETAPAASQSSADTVWIVAAGALVFLMQAGFAMLESGMSRSKNAVNVIMKNYCDTCFGAIAFWLVGYGLMFGSNASGWIGTDHFAPSTMTPMGYTWLFFQTMFAATAATIPSGAIAERTRFWGYIVASIVVTGIVYPVYGSWAWGSLYEGEGWLRALGFVDFAGSTVVHSIGGWTALAALLVIGPRTGRYGPDGRARTIPGHNLTSVALGAFFLWMGWFGFNGGSTVAASVDIGKIVINTHLAGAAGAIGAMAAMRATGQPLLLTGTINGSLAGLVAITAGCAVMTPPFAVLTGFLGGIVMVGATMLLDRLRIDDVVGAVAVHGFSGAFGTIAAGAFHAGQLFDLRLIAVQVLGVVVAFLWAFPVSYVLWWAIARTIGARASTSEEQRGLDYSEHYEVGYPEFQRDALNLGKP